MKVYVTLAGTDKKLRLRVPETWAEFVSILRERFDVPTDAELELKDASML